MEGRPGIAHLLEEVAGAGAAYVVVVYHPYYERFVSWARHVLTPGGQAGYARRAGLTAGEEEPSRLRVDWVAQHGCYADVTSVFNGVDHLAGVGVEGGDVYVAFGDNLYQSGGGYNALAALREAPDGVAVLGSGFREEFAAHRGVMVTEPGPEGVARMVRLVEKPGVEAACALRDRYGADSLLMFEGRARLDDVFVGFARRRAGEAGGEPKLAAALGAYAAKRPVWVVRTDARVVELGSWDATPCDAAVS